MDALVIQNSTTATNATTINNSPPDTLHHHSIIAQPHIHCCSEAQLLDSVTETLVSVDKWVAQELDRISHNYTPRNCSNYETLLSVIEGFYQTEQYLPPTTMNYRHLVKQRPQEYIEEGEDKENEEEDEINEDSVEINVKAGNYANERLMPTERPPLLASAASHAPSQLQQDQVKDKNNGGSSTSQADNMLPPSNRTPIATIRHDQLTQNNLVLAFSKLIDYCQNESPLFYLNVHLRKPLELLLELENMCDSKQKQQDAYICQTKLAQILFGDNIPIMNKLIESWTMICLWVQQEIDISSPFQQRKWIIFGICCYQIAKKLCGISSESK